MNISLGLSFRDCCCHAFQSVSVNVDGARYRERVDRYTLRSPVFNRCTCYLVLHVLLAT